MCGIAGVVLPGYESVNPDFLDAAVDSMYHRGPDDRGVCRLTDAGSGAVGLFGQRRLSILDLSHAGHQPMHSPDGKLTIVYNGEVYNYTDIRRDLEALGHQFRSHCDTEVILAAYQQWGEDFIHRCNGMFAIAIWDGERARIVLYRDRIGFKPLYLGIQGKRFCFASVLSALIRIPGFCRKVDHNALLAYIWAGYVPGPYSMFEGIEKLPPGHKAVYDIRRHSLRIERYWDIAEIAAVPDDPTPASTDEQYIEELDALLRDAVRIQLMSDVPLGAFLSGGVDSSLVVALMKQVSSDTVRTFSIGFSVEEFNEAPAARAIAQYLDTEHNEQIVTADDAKAMITEVPKYYDEPFSDSSCLPTMLLSQMTRQHVAVALSGDGGDEVFLGSYRHYRLAPQWRKTAWMPAPLRSVVGGLLNVVPHRYVKRIAQAVQCRNMGEYYKLITSIWQGAEFPNLVRGDVAATLARTPHARAAQQLETVGRNDVRTVATLDFYGIMPDDFLVKVDRATMIWALEARAPMLDHRVVEFSRRLPDSVLFRYGQNKRLERALLAKYLPRSLWERPKKGFAVPLAKWFREDLYDTLRESLLDAGGLPFDVFDRPTVEQIIAQHRDGRVDRYRLLWSLMSLSMWYRTYLV